MHEIDPTLNTLVQQTMDDLAQQLSISSEAIEPASARSVVWPDSSLSYPRPGLVFPQVQVDGVQIELRAGKRFF